MRLSSHAAEFYLMQFDDLWALLSPASSPLHPASLLVRVPAAKSSLPVLSACALRPRPNLPLRLASSPPSGSFHPDSSQHLPSTLERATCPSRSATCRTQPNPSLSSIFPLQLIPLHHRPTNQPFCQTKPNLNRRFTLHPIAYQQLTESKCISVTYHICQNEPNLTIALHANETHFPEFHSGFPS